MEAKNVAKAYKLTDRIHHLPITVIVITLKDRKDNIYNKPSCRLINLNKNELWNTSKKNIE